MSEISNYISEQEFFDSLRIGEGEELINLYSDVKKINITLAPEQYLFLKEALGAWASLKFVFDASIVIHEDYLLLGIRRLYIQRFNMSVPKSLSMSLFQCEAHLLMRFIQEKIGDNSFFSVRDIYESLCKSLSNSK